MGRNRKTRSGNVAGGGLSPEVRDLVRQARADGWTVDTTNGSHLAFSKPGRETVYSSKTPSDHRAVLNIRGKLRRAERKALEQQDPKEGTDADREVRHPAG